MPVEEKLELKLKFLDDDGDITIMTIADIKSNVTQAEVQAIADVVTNSLIFANSKGLPLVVLEEAYTLLTRKEVIEVGGE